MDKHDYPRVLSASTMIGTEVRNPQGESLGKIEEIMLDLNVGRVAYAVLSFGGFLGMGDKLFAVPWAALEVDHVNEQVVLDADKERLENAPGFDKDNWSKTPNAQWYHEIYEYYGEKPYWMETA